MFLITGASQGIGFECARQLLERTAARVMITARHEPGLVCARDRLPAKMAGRLELGICDQARAEDLDRLLEALDRAPEPVSGVILNVGINPAYTEGPRRLHALSFDTILDTVTTNCTHLAYLSGRLLERLRRREGACVVWVGSRAVDQPLPGHGIYAACKSFLTALVRAAEVEYRAKGVRVHLIHPGATRTPRTARLLDSVGTLHGVAVRDACDAGGRIVDILLDPAFSEREVRL